MTDFDRLVARETHLGVVRQILPPTDHIGLSIAPLHPVESDDVVFDYVTSFDQDNMAPARAEDAESEIAERDMAFGGQGRASVLDWAIKDVYRASDVTKYQESLLMQRALEGVNTPLNLMNPGRMAEDFSKRLARDTADRRRRLDNRLEWLIMTSLYTNALSYDDGKTKWSISDWGRPAAQTAASPLAYNSGSTALWDAGKTHDPVGNVLAIQDYMWNAYRVHMRHAYVSRKTFNAIWASELFLSAPAAVLTGTGIVGGTPSTPISMPYLNPAFTKEAAARFLEDATGITFHVYDSVYRARTPGSSLVRNVRFTDQRDILFLPDTADLAGVDDTEIGFAKTLTSPHPEGNWQSGFYAWEEEERDPWQRVLGTGIKAFPVFPYMQYTYTARVLGSTGEPTY
jgi:hypothetical protein